MNHIIIIIIIIYSPENVEIQGDSCSLHTGIPRIEGSERTNIAGEDLEGVWMNKDCDTV